MVSLCSIFFKIDRIPSFEIRYSLFDIRPARNALKRLSTFDIRFFEVSFLDQTGRSAARVPLPALRSLEGEGGTPDTHLHGQSR